jgi:hypothetical protein
MRLWAISADAVEGIESTSGVVGTDRNNDGELSVDWHVLAVMVSQKSERNYAIVMEPTSRGKAHRIKDHRINGSTPHPPAERRKGFALRHAQNRADRIHRAEKPNSALRSISPQSSSRGGRAGIQT